MRNVNSLMALGLSAAVLGGCSSKETSSRNNDQQHQRAEQVAVNEVAQKATAHFVKMTLQKLPALRKENTTTRKHHTLKPFNITLDKNFDGAGNNKLLIREYRFSRALGNCTLSNDTEITAIYDGSDSQKVTDFELENSSGYFSEKADKKGTYVCHDPSYKDFEEIDDKYTFKRSHTDNWVVTQSGFGTTPYTDAKTADMAQEVTSQAYDALRPLLHEGR